MLFAELALAAKIFEGALQFVGECFKHYFLGSPIGLFIGLGGSANAFPAIDANFGRAAMVLRRKFHCRGREKGGQRVRGWGFLDWSRLRGAATRCATGLRCVKFADPLPNARCMNEMPNLRDAEFKKYPKNWHVRDKIRQQLQVFRDKGLLEFLGSGTYRLT